jgi:sortase A
MNWRRTTGAVLAAAGVVLLAVAVVPTIYGRVMARVAVAEFRAESPAKSLWDGARIRAYERSLSQTMPAPEAVLRMPRLGVEAPVFEGTSDLAMNRGLGHIAGTALPGQAGNVAVAGHRDGFFRPLKDVRVGDVIEVERPERAGQEKATDRYIVRRTAVISPEESSVLRSQGGVAELTLVTCYPFYFVGAAPQRFVVQASRVPAAYPTQDDTTVMDGPPRKEPPSFDPKHSTPGDE